MKTPTFEEIIADIKETFIQDVLRVVKRLDSRSTEEIIQICGNEKQDKLYRHLMNQIIEEDIVKVTDRGLVMLSTKGEELAEDIDDAPPRSYTDKEASEVFIKILIDIGLEWESMDKPSWNKISGTIFSILSLIDGGTYRIPGFYIMSDEGYDGIQYYKEHGMNWFPPDEPFNEDIVLHEMYHPILRKVLGEKNFPDLLKITEDASP